MRYGATGMWPCLSFIVPDRTPTLWRAFSCSRRFFCERDRCAAATRPNRSCAPQTSRPGCPAKWVLRNARPPDRNRLPGTRSPHAIPPAGPRTLSRHANLMASATARQVNRFRTGSLTPPGSALAVVRDRAAPTTAPQNQVRPSDSPRADGPYTIGASVTTLASTATHGTPGIVSRARPPVACPPQRRYGAFGGDLAERIRLGER